MRDKRARRAPLLAGDGPLAKVPPVVAFLAVIAIFVAAIVVRGALGAVLLGVLALGVTVLLVGTWRALTESQRLARVLVLALLVAAAITMLYTG